MYVRVHFLPYFGSLEEITTAGVADYSLRRLRSVKRKTVHKERGALHSFLWWCKGRHIDSVPLFDPLPKHATGKPDPQGRFKRHWVALTPEEVLAVLAELPVKSRRGYPARDYYTFLYETSLRPETVWSIHIPTDYKPGRATLKIRAEIDKNRFARDVELTDAARAALDAVCPEVGHPFPRSRLRETLRAAGLRAGLEPDRAGALSDYDFRHNRITHWTETAGDNLPGIAWLSGHKLITTLNNYAKPNARASRDVLARATGTKSNPEDIRRTSKTKERRTK